MRGKGTLILLIGALVASLISVFGGDNLSRLESLNVGLQGQQQRNDDLRRYISSLKYEVNGLKHNDRALEKAARNELGMARPDELVIFFDEKK